MEIEFIKDYQPEWKSSPIQAGKRGEFLKDYALKLIEEGYAVAVNKVSLEVIAKPKRSKSDK